MMFKYEEITPELIAELRAMLDGQKLEQDEQKKEDHREQQR